MIPVLLVGNFLSAHARNRAVCEDLAARLAASGWPILTTSAEPDRLPRLLDMVTTVCRRRNEYVVAHVDVFSGPAFVWAEIACGLLSYLGKPHVLTLHGGNLPVFARRWPSRVRRVLRAAACVTTPSGYLLEEMRPYRPDVELQPNPLDLTAYTFRLRERPRPRLVWVRAFHRIYNPSLAPAVVARLAHEFPDVRLTMIGPDLGDGSLRETQRIAEALSVADRITYPGLVPKADVGRWLDDADIFISTTNIDNTPISVLEAMAAGLPVVCSRAGGLPYLVEHEWDGLLVPCGAPGAMAAAVRRVLTDPEPASRLSVNARRKAERCDWNVVLPQWQQRLDAVARAPSGPHAARPASPAGMFY